MSRFDPDGISCYDLITLFDFFCHILWHSMELNFTFKSILWSSTFVSVNFCSNRFFTLLNLRRMAVWIVKFPREGYKIIYVYGHTPWNSLCFLDRIVLSHQKWVPMFWKLKFTKPSQFENKYCDPYTKKNKQIGVY